jgi:hypothetical protein
MGPLRRSKLLRLLTVKMQEAANRKIIAEQLRRGYFFLREAPRSWRGWRSSFYRGVLKQHPEVKMHKFAQRSRDASGKELRQHHGILTNMPGLAALK